MECDEINDIEPEARENHMTRPNHLRWMTVLMSVCLLLASVTGCDKDDDPAGPTAQAPDLPPLTSFVMDFDDFQEVRAHGGPDNGQVAASLNWTFSAINVGVWNIILTTGLIVPTAAFVEAFNHEPVFVNGWWTLSYNFFPGGVTHTARLQGKVQDGQVIWEMYISRSGLFTDFLWYSGVVELDGSEGQWILYTAPDDPVTMLQIDWHRDADLGTADLKYTNIIPENDENGGYIFYGSTASDTFDRCYDIYHKSADNLTEIEWNFTTKVGRVKDETHFGDTDWHCWDELLQDVVCP